MQKNKFNIGDSILVNGESLSSEGNTQVVSIFRDLILQIIMTNSTKDDFVAAKKSIHKDEIHYFVAVIGEGDEFIEEGIFPESALTLKE